MTWVETAIVAMVFLSVFWVAGAEWTFRFLQRRGNELAAGRRRRFYLMMTPALGAAGFCGVAFSTGHAGVGVIVFIVVFVLPEFVSSRFASAALAELQMRRGNDAGPRDRRLPRFSNGTDPGRASALSGVIIYALESRFPPLT